MFLDFFVLLKVICSCVRVFTLVTKKSDSLMLGFFVLPKIIGNFLVKDLMTPPLGVKNVKIQENSEKIRGPPGGP